MKELFSSDGHLTGEALEVLMRGELDELERLEVGEHLSFCDTCLARYTSLLTEEVQLSPPDDQTLPVMRRLWQRIWTGRVRRYASAAAAVALAGALWYTGAFDAMGKGMMEAPAALLRQKPEAPAITVQGATFGDAFIKAVDDWSDWVLDLNASGFDHAAMKEQQHAAQSAQEMEEDHP